MVLRQYLKACAVEVDDVGYVVGLAERRAVVEARGEEGGPDGTHLGLPAGQAQLKAAYGLVAADIAVEGETEPAESKLDKWFEEHATPAVQNVLMTCAAFVGVVLALFLFTFLPTFLTGLVMKVVPLGRWPRVILEGALKECMDKDAAQKMIKEVQA